MKIRISKAYSVLLLPFAALLLSSVFSSCRKEPVPVPRTFEKLCALMPVFESEQSTRTSMDGTQTSPVPVWEAGDEIEVFDGNGNHATYRVDAGRAGTSRATFTCCESKVPSFAGKLYAYYPASQYNDFNTSTAALNVGVGLVQPYFVTSSTGKNAGSFSSGVFPMVARCADTSENNLLTLSFRYVFGLLQLNFKSGEDVQGISEIEIASSSSALSGTADIENFDTDSPTCTLSGDKVVRLDCTEAPGLSSEASAFYIALPPCSITYIRIKDSSGNYYVRKMSKSIVAGTIKSIKVSTVKGAGFVTYGDNPSLEPVFMGTTYWAPVNCGYSSSSHPYGKLYQWGRKNGSGYEGEQSVQTPAASYTAPEDSNKFYKSDGDWLPTSDDSRWSLTKSGYDPCPDGWRVPSADELSSVLAVYDAMSDSDKGLKTFDGINGYCVKSSTGSLFLPAAGYIDNCDGSSSGRSDSAMYYWSFSAGTDTGTSQALGNTEGYPLVENNMARAFGFSVRCVKL